MILDVHADSIKKRMFLVINSREEFINRTQDKYLRVTCHLSFTHMPYEAIRGLFIKDSPLETWDMSQCPDMHNMFEWCHNINHIDFSGWDTGSCTNMSEMFEGCKKFNNHTIKNWDVSACVNARGIFAHCHEFNVDLSAWNTKSIVNASYMFLFCASFDQDLSSWNVSNIENAHCMFRDCRVFNQKLNWDMKSCTDSGEMFYTCLKLRYKIKYPNNYSMYHLTRV